jgi:hypothetical protein
MICHQHVGINPTPTFDLGLSETFQEETEIIVTEKSSSAIVSALDNVMRMSRNCDSRRSCHAASQCQQTLSEPIAGLAYRQEKSSLTPFFRFFPGVHPALLTTRAAYRLHESPLLRIYESQLGSLSITSGA